MSAEEITASVENIEVEAERVLEEARARASEIIMKAKDEAGKIMAAELSLDEVAGEREQIVKQAEQQAAREVEAAEKQAAAMKDRAGKKTGEIAKRIVSVVSGVEVK